MLFSVSGLDLRLILQPWLAVEAPGNGHRLQPRFALVSDAGKSVADVGPFWFNP